MAPSNILFLVYVNFIFLTWKGEGGRKVCLRERKVFPVSLPTTGALLIGNGGIGRGGG